MAGDYLIRWFEDDDLETYISGLNTYIYEDYDEEWFRWKFLDNPHNPGFLSIAVVVNRSGEPVAFNGFLPLEVRLGKRSFKVVQGCDGFVSRDHRRRGLFQKTIEFMSRELKEFDLLIGFNYQESALAALKAGCITWGTASKYHLRPTEIERTGLNPKNEITLTLCRIEETEGIYEEWASSFQYFHINRDQDYLHWRFERNPRIRYQLRKVELNGSPIGYISYLIEEVKGSRVIKVEDHIFNLTDPATFLRCLLNLAEEHKAEEVVGLTLESEKNIKRLLGKLDPYLKLNPVYTMIMRGIRDPELRGYRTSGEWRDITLPESWYLTKSDAFEIG